jgi:hypothetical protein
MNDLANIENNDLAELSEFLGTQVGNDSGGSDIARVPELKIQSKTREKGTKKAVTPGTFYLSNMDKIVYSETVKFRPICSHIQYYHWGEVDGKRKLICKSRATKNQRDEARDTNGGVACGMPSWDARKEMDKDTQRHWRSMQHRVTRGLVTMTGKTADGEEVTIENQPVIMFHKNSTYSGFWKGFMQKLPKGRQLFEYEATLTSEYQEQGDVEWYTLNYDVDLSNPLVMDLKDDYSKSLRDTMKVFADTIKAENAYVDSKYFEALKEGALDDIATEALGDSLDDDFEAVA